MRQDFGSEKCSRSIPMAKQIILATLNLRIAENTPLIANNSSNQDTVKLGNKERFYKEQIGVKEPFPVTNLPFTSYA